MSDCASEAEVRQRGRGRPRGFEAKQALEAVMLLFWRQGYRATSLDDLASASGAARASLYQLFGDKRAMLLRSLELYAARFRDRVEASLAAAPDARAALATVMNGSADRLCSAEGPPGCLRCRMTLELRGADSAIDAALASANAVYLDGMAHLVAAGVARGELRAEAAVGLPPFFTAMVNGLVVMAESGAGRDTLGEVIARALTVWPDPPVRSFAPRV